MSRDARNDEVEVSDEVTVGQMPGESAKAFEAWLLYREMSPSLRSIRTAAARLGKSATLIGRWSSEHRWQERIGAWDEQAAGERAAEWLETARRVAREQIEVGDELVALGRAALAQADPAAITPATAVRLIGLGSRLMRVGAGLEEPTIAARDAARLADFLIDAAMPFVPDESSAAFLQTLSEAGKVAGAIR